MVRCRTRSGKVILTDEELSIYEIAFHLKTPVYKLSEMPYTELLGWYNYFERRPVDWRDDDRTFKLLQAQGVKAKPQEIFPSLEALQHKPKREGTFDSDSFKKSAFFQKIMTAQGGDTLDL